MVDEAVLFEPRYIEAYPQLRIARAVRGVASGYTLVLWRNEAGDPVGSASTSLPAPDRLRVSVELFQTKTTAEFMDTVDVPLVLKQAGQFRQEHYGVCRCGRTVKVLIYRRLVWQCARCHQLIHRSARTSRPIRLVEQLAKVTQELGSGRKPGMHNTTYQRLLEERAWLEEELGGFRGTANTDYTSIVTAEFARQPSGWGRPR